MVVYEGAALGVWLAYRQAGTSLGVGVFAQSLTGQVFLLPLLLAAVIYWSSSDLLEWGELGGHVLLRVVRRGDPVGQSGIPLLLIGLASVAALGVALDVLRVYGGSVLLAALLATALAGLLALLAVFARMDATWPTQVPTRAVLAGVVFLFCEFVLEYQIGYALASWRGLPVDAAGPAVGVMVGMFVVVVAMTAGVLLVARGRLLRRGELGATGLFLVAAALLSLLGGWSLILDTLGLPAPHHPLHLLAGVRLVAALGTLGLVGWALARPPAHRGDVRRPLAAALLLLIDLQLIEWWFDVVAAQTALGALSPLAFSALFLVAVFWDVLTSGEGITNGDSRAFPRDGRVLLYLGYTLVASSVLLYAATVRIAASGALSADTLSTGNDAALGLLILGIPMVLLGFVLRVGAWLATRQPTVHATHGATVPARKSLLADSQAAILGIGLVALLGVIALTTWRVVPLAVAGAQSGPPTRGTPVSTTTPASFAYRAHAPGPGCDTDGAQWTLVPPDASAQCGPSGLRVSVDASSSVLLGFAPPGGRIPADYQVAVRVDLSAFASGCVGIITRASIQGFYEADLCADGEWGIFRKTGATQQIGQGIIAPATIATIVVVMQGAHLTFSVDGSTLGTITDATLTASDFIDLAFNNLGNAASSAVVSDFVYQPRE
jgi:hypothetical protein